MAAKLAFDKSITREMQLRIFPKPVNITLDHEGVTLAVKGCKKKITIDWLTLVGHASTPQDVPAKFYQRAELFLLSQMK
jgi:hypothetical protein